MTLDAQEHQDARRLAEAVDLAVGNVAAGGGPFAHAEVVAIRTACRELGDFRLNGCVLVTSCEQWPMAVTSTAVADPAAPFTAGRAKPDRVDY
jgi:tRNA(Arg) A34 adenosine deaminase TadA